MLQTMELLNVDERNLNQHNVEASNLSQSLIRRTSCGDAAETERDNSYVKGFSLIQWNCQPVCQLFYIRTCFNKMENICTNIEY